MRKKIITYPYDYIDLYDAIDIAKIYLHSYIGAREYYIITLSTLALHKPRALVCEMELYTLEAAINNYHAEQNIYKIDMMKMIRENRPNKSL